jgi:hypothetical protein
MDDGQEVIKAQVGSLAFLIAVNQGSLDAKIDTKLYACREDRGQSEGIKRHGFFR